MASHTGHASSYAQYMSLLSDSDDEDSEDNNVTLQMAIAESMNDCRLLSLTMCYIWMSGEWEGPEVEAQ